MNDLAKNLILWAVIAVVLLSVFSNFNRQNATSQTIDAMAKRIVNGINPRALEIVQQKIVMKTAIMTAIR